MFSLKADIIRALIGLALLNLTTHWVFTTAGAILLLCVTVNLFIHFKFPHLMPTEADIFPNKQRQTFASLVQEDRTTH